MSATPIGNTFETENVVVNFGDRASLHDINANPHHGRYQDYIHEEMLSKQIVDVGGGLFVLGILTDPGNLYIGPLNDFKWGYNTYRIRSIPDVEDLFEAKALSEQAYTKVVKARYRWAKKDILGRWGYWSQNWNDEVVVQEDCYNPGDPNDFSYEFDPNLRTRQPYAYIKVQVTVQGVASEHEFRFRLPNTGKVTVDEIGPYPGITVEVNALGLTRTFYEEFDVSADQNSRYTRNPLEILQRHLRFSQIEGGKEALWRAFLARWCSDPNNVEMAGLSSIYSRKAFAPNFERLQTEQPVEWAFLRWLHGKETANGQRNNQLLSVFYQTVADNYDKLMTATREAMIAAETLTPDWHEGYRSHAKTDGWPLKRAICLTLPGVADKVHEVEAKKDFRKRKTAGGQADGLGVTADKYPKLREAIENEDIPIGIFNQPGKDGQPVNREFALWEKALSQKDWAPTLFEICANAARRGTYERDITPYLNALFKWPAFLDKHTPGRKRWRAMPKFVQSQWELEMANEGNDDNGVEKTRKERSAFTPQVDNDQRILTIPYVAVCVSGVRTQWCYSMNYYLFEEGFTDPETGGIVLNDYEANLNGVGDDYGLCYFTLTGTSTARGYPTFLIILERREGGDTHVHFHRVRPCRSTNGVKTPACELVGQCYQYMAGNVPATEVAAQQGDLLFIRHPNDPIKAKAKVADDPAVGAIFEFESHRFQSDNPEVGLTMYRSTAKTPRNRMGFCYAPSGLSVIHPEHDDILGLEEGWYEVRRCKSYENNPVGIWSLTID